MAPRCGKKQVSEKGKEKSCSTRSTRPARTGVTTERKGKGRKGGGKEKGKGPPPPPRDLRPGIAAWCRPDKKEGGEGDKTDGQASLGKKKRGTGGGKQARP